MTWELLLTTVQSEFSQYTLEVALKTNHVLACTWGPHFLLDKWKAERVQCRTTKLMRACIK